MYYTVYKITNNVNKKIYIGVHKTKYLDDGYMGSGSQLKLDQEKYGIENFEKEILHLCDSSEKMYEMESILVNENFVVREDTYNMIKGGIGGWDNINSNRLNLYGKNGRSGYGGENLVSGDVIKEKLIREGRFENFKKDISESLKKNIAENGHWWIGKTHEQEAKDKISKASSIHQAGEKNSQYGKRWITNVETGKRKQILKEDAVPEGWIYSLEASKIKTRMKTTVSRKTKIAKKDTGKDLQKEYEKILEEKRILKEQKRLEDVLRYSEWYEIYREVGFEEFCKQTGYQYSKPALVQGFAKFVEEFVPQNGKKRKIS